MILAEVLVEGVAAVTGILPSLSARFSEVSRIAKLLDREVSFWAANDPTSQFMYIYDSEAYTLEQIKLVVAIRKGL